MSKNAYMDNLTAKVAHVNLKKHHFLLITNYCLPILSITFSDKISLPFTICYKS